MSVRDDKSQLFRCLHVTREVWRTVTLVQKHAEEDPVICQAFKSSWFLYLGDVILSLVCFLFFCIVVL